MRSLSATIAISNAWDAFLQNDALCRDASLPDAWAEIRKSLGEMHVSQPEICACCVAIILRACNLHFIPIR